MNSVVPDSNRPVGKIYPTFCVVGQIADLYRKLETQASYIKLSILSEGK